MSTIRINELARELEVPSRTIVESLGEFGVADKKTHSSAIEPDLAGKIRAYFAEGLDARRAAAAISPDAGSVQAESEAVAERPPPTPPALPKPEAVKPEPPKVEIAKPESVKPESVKPESVKPRICQA